MDLDFWDCFGRKKTPSYKRINMVVCFLFFFLPNSALHNYTCTYRWFTMNQFSHTLYLYLQMVYHESIQPYIILVLTDGLPPYIILVLTDGLPCLNSAIHYTCTYRWFTMPQFSHTLYLYLQMVYHASIQPYIYLYLQMVYHISIRSYIYLHLYFHVIYYVFT